MQQRFSWLRTLSQLLVLAVVTFAGLNYQFFLDQYALATFKPAADVASIENTLSLTDQGRALFYRARPRIDEKAGFNVDCETSQGVLELGCFYRDQIYILRIEDPRL